MVGFQIFGIRQSNLPPLHFRYGVSNSFIFWAHSHRECSDRKFSKFFIENTNGPVPDLLIFCLQNISLLLVNILQLQTKKKDFHQDLPMLSKIAVVTAFFCTRLVLKQVPSTKINNNPWNSPLQ